MGDTARWCIRLPWRRICSIDTAPPHQTSPAARRHRRRRVVTRRRLCAITGARTGCLASGACVTTLSRAIKHLGDASTSASDTSCCVAAWCMRLSRIARAQRRHIISSLRLRRRRHLALRCCLSRAHRRCTAARINATQTKHKRGIAVACGIAALGNQRHLVCVRVGTLGAYHRRGARASRHRSRKAWRAPPQAAHHNNVREIIREISSIRRHQIKRMLRINARCGSSKRAS